MPSQTILVTGGAGYIGAHVLVSLSEQGYACLPLDNYCNSSPDAVRRVRSMATNVLEPVQVDIRDGAGLRRVLAAHRIDAVIHLAGLKAVGEAEADPLAYYDNNVAGTLTLLQALKESPVRRFIFSSSATVYGTTDNVPYVETSPRRPTNVYGRTKYFIEEMLSDLARSDASWKVASLRYFNPIGAHPSGTIGESPLGIPNNLMPIVCRVASGRQEKLRVFGDDYPTPDGTCIRDYIHVMDLAEGHVAALSVLDACPAGEPLALNLGTGRGYSVSELVAAFEKVNGVPVPREVVGRRPGDLSAYWANASRAAQVLGWSPKRSLEDMCRDSWAWHVRNPGGYSAS